MSDENTEKKFRSEDDLVIYNARVMWVGEPRDVKDDLRLCSAKVVSQPGNDRDQDCWITFTGSNKLGERIYGLAKGDRVNVAGKPFFSAYIDKEGAPKCSVEIKFPRLLQVVHREETGEPATEPEDEDIPVTPAVKKGATETAPAKRGPGRPKKSLVFDE